MDIRALSKEGHSIKAICRLTGFSRNTVRRVLRQAGPQGYRSAECHVVGTRLNVKRIRDLLRSHARAAGLDIRVTPHTCATAARRTSCRGADMHHVQRLLRHSSVQTTAIYTHVDTKDLARAMRRRTPGERTYNRRRKGTSWRSGLR